MNGNSVQLETVDDIPAGNAVILKSTASTITLTRTTKSADFTDNDLHGVDGRTLKSTLGTGTFYVMGKVGDDFGFFEYTGDYMPARKAYVLVSGGGAPLRMVMKETTGISAALNDKGEMINDKWCTLDGRMLEGKPTARGIYIHNGRKEAVR